jgi:hypothetical protein
MSDLTIPLKVVDNGDETYSTTSVINAALPAGGNTIGKVGIDQTADATTNRVVAKISQVAGENVIKVAGGESLIQGVKDVTTAGTRVQLSSVSQPCREVLVIAKRTNAGRIYVGNSSVSSTDYGADLGAKESVSIPVANLNLIYIDSSVDGEGVSYLAI